MSDRDLIKALKILRGASSRGGSKAPPADGTKEADALDVMTQIDDLALRAAGVRSGQGKLQSATKAEALDKVESLRAVILHWPAWVTPEKGKRVR